MTIIVQELNSDNLKQEMKVQDKDVTVAAIRPHLYRQRSPSGSLFLEVQDENGLVCFTSETIAISAIGTLDFFHGYIRFFIDASLKANTIYNISLRSTGGYSFAESDFIGWCNDFDLQKYGRNYVPTGSINAALDMEIWERTVIPKEDIDD